MRSRGKGPSEREAAYDSLYGDDERHKAEMRMEERRQERAAQRAARRREREAEEGHEDEGEAEEEEDLIGPAMECPKCGSAKVMEMEDGEWMCLRCSKVFK
jgi:ribosomal protein S27AE